MFEDEDTTAGTPKPSKSRLKREAQAALDLARRLVSLDAGALHRIDMPESVREALAQTRRIESPVARKRQLHFLAKQLRKTDIEPLRAQLDAIHARRAGDARRFHAIEQWRDRLIAEGDEAVQAFIDLHPQVDIQRLRHYVRSARREADNQKPPRAARELFRYLREFLSDSSRVGPADRQ